MGARDNLQRLIDRKQQEIEELESHLGEARVYVQALQDAIRALPKENLLGSSEASLRPGTIVYRVREMLKASGKPMHISEILKELGRPVDKDNRVSVAGTLSAYVRDGQIFSRPAPNTYGLIDGMPAAPLLTEELPDSFGT